MKLRYTDGKDAELDFLLDAVVAEKLDSSVRIDLGIQYVKEREGKVSVEGLEEICGVGMIIRFFLSLIFLCQTVVTTKESTHQRMKSKRR